MGKTHEFVIEGRLPGINELIDSNRAGLHAGASLKAKAQKRCEAAIREQLGRLKITEPVRIHYIFYEMNMRRDLDNISGMAHKVIRDALVKCRTLQNDGWKEIKGYTDTFAVDKHNPRIIVMLEVVEDGR